MKKIKEKLISYVEMYAYLNQRALFEIMNIEYKKIECLNREYRNNNDYRGSYGNIYDNIINKIIEI